jgi:hypothetical protein
VVVSSFPVGPGNLKNLEAAQSALRSGKRVFVVQPEPGKSVDFVDGKASKIITGLISSGAIQVNAVDDLLAKLSGGGI